MDTPKRIWLIDMGDEIVWCDCQDPTGGVHPDDTVEYVRVDRDKVLAKQSEISQCTCASKRFKDSSSGCQIHGIYEFGV